MLIVRTYVAVSPIHGLGVFAAEAIKKGTDVWIFHPGIDLVATPAQIRALPQAVQEFWAVYGHRLDPVLPWTCDADLAKFYNHSDDPNTGPDPSGPRADIGQIAYRDIAIDEELTADYHSFSCDADLLLAGLSPAELVQKMLYPDS